MKKVKNDSHSRVSLSGISTLEKKRGGDPRLQASGMTAKINRHAEESLLSIPTAVNMQGRDPKQQHLRMTLCRGFTLIELLVVVLIIGILAAVALPQYQKAVEKTRLNSAVATIANLQKAIDLWLLENGGFPSSSVDFKPTKNNETTPLPIDVTSGLNCVPVGRNMSIECTDMNGYLYSTVGCGVNWCGISAMYQKGNYWWLLEARKEQAEGEWIKEYTDSTESSLSISLLAGLESQGWRNAC